MTHFCAWYRRYYGVKETDGVAAYASFGFDACLMDLYPALTAGAMVHIIPEAMRLDVEAIDRYFEEQGVTLAFMTTQLGRQFADNREGRSLRHLSTGGETLVPIGPSASYNFHNLYGPTEGTIISTAFPIDRLYDRVPIGKPVDNTRIYILDSHNRLAPIGVPGELCIAGRGVAHGYLGRPELTGEKFVPNPFSEEDDYSRLYRTGDLVRYLPDGNLDFVGPSGYNPNSVIAGQNDQAETDPRWMHHMPERSWSIFTKTFYPRPPVLGPYNNPFLSGTPYGATDII